MEKSEFAKISQLSGLELEQEEAEILQSEFEVILKHIGNIDKVSTDDMVPLYHLNEEQYLREDKSKDSGDKPEDLLENSPNKKGNYVEFKKK